MREDALQVSVVFAPTLNVFYYLPVGDWMKSGMSSGRCHLQGGSRATNSRKVLLSLRAGLVVCKIDATVATLLQVSGSCDGGQGSLEQLSCHNIIMLTCTLAMREQEADAAGERCAS